MNAPFHRKSSSSSSSIAGIHIPDSQLAVETHRDDQPLGKSEPKAKGNSMSASLAPASPVSLKPVHRTQNAAPTNRDHLADTSSQFPKRGRRFILLLLSGGLLLGVLGYWYFTNAGYETTDDATIQSHVIQVSPRVSAQVKAVDFDDNYQVRRGDLLVALDPRDFEVSRAIAAASLASARSKVVEAQAQQNAALAGLGQSKADLSSAEATAENAEADFHRNEDLYKTKVVDRREYDASEAQAKSSAAAVESSVKKIASQEAEMQLASAQYNTALAEQSEAEAQLRQADLQLSYTKILAPFDGRITKKSIEPGDYVQPGQTLFSLVPNEVWVIANFKETQLKQMKVGQPVSIKVDALPGREFRAHVESFQVGTGSVFTLLPPENATGNFVKVVQRVPVKIVFDEAATSLDRLWAGESVEPRVNTRITPSGKASRAIPLPPALLGRETGDAA
jgi:membrane fusion protein, multidrug efflux system